MHVSFPSSISPSGTAAWVVSGISHSDFESGNHKLRIAFTTLTGAPVISKTKLVAASPTNGTITGLFDVSGEGLVNNNVYEFVFLIVDGNNDTVDLSPGHTLTVTNKPTPTYLNPVEPATPDSYDYRPAVAEIKDQMVAWTKLFALSVHALEGINAALGSISATQANQLDELKKHTELLASLESIKASQISQANDIKTIAYRASTENVGIVVNNDGGMMPISRAMIVTTLIKNNELKEVIREMKNPTPLPGEFGPET
jgi:hypothetical protein